MHNFKNDFLLNPEVVFLNHGSFGAVPKPVFAEYQHWQHELELQPVEFLGRRFPALMQEARAALASFFNVMADDLVYISNATEGINIVAHSLDLKAEDEVLATDHEYGAADRIWRFLAAQNGFKYINQGLNTPFTDMGLIADQFMSGITPRTRVIFISHYTSPTAVILPVKDICQRAREKGILTVVDGAHAPGQIDLDLNALGADFYIGNLHKWLCAPKGSAFLYAHPQCQSLILPLIVSWGWQSEQPGPSTFIDYLEWTGTRDISAFLSVPAAIKYQKENHWSEVRAACHTLASEARNRIYQITGLPGIYPDSARWYAQMGVAPLPDRINAKIFKDELYSRYKIELPVSKWKNHNLLRFSFQAYNSLEDIIKLEQALKHLLC